MQKPTLVRGVSPVRAMAMPTASNTGSIAPPPTPRAYLSQQKSAAIERPHVADSLAASASARRAAMVHHRHRHPNVIGEYLLSRGAERMLRRSRAIYEGFAARRHQHIEARRDARPFQQERKHAYRDQPRVAVAAARQGGARGAMRNDRGSVPLPHKFGPATDTHGRITRVYRSVEFFYENTTNQLADGFGWSLFCAYDTANNVANMAIVGGQPTSGANINGQAITFPQFQAEHAWFGNTFRYMAIKSMKFVVVRMPQSVYQLDGASAVANAPYDTGTITVMPWCGQPGRVNYTTGVLSTLNPIEYERWKRKKVFSASSRAGTEAETSYYTPTQTLAIPVNDNPAGAGEAPDVTYVKTPPVDVLFFRLGYEVLHSFGGILFHHHPSCYNFPTGTLRYSGYWEVEIDYWDHRIPVAYVPGVTDPKLDPAKYAYPIALLAPAGTDPNAPDQLSHNDMVKREPADKEDFEMDNLEHDIKKTKI